MNRIVLSTIAASCVAIAGCDSQDVENTPIDDIDEIVEDDDEGYPVGGELSDEQQARYDTFDREAAVQEYDSNQAAMTAPVTTEDGAANGSSTGTNMPSGGQVASSIGESAPGTSEEASNMGGGISGTEVTPLRPRSKMDFAFLDRNGDGELSVAEYAIWAVGSNPLRPKENDQTLPYTSPEQINEAGRTFFYFDEDGDTYLSPEEFAAARASARTPS